MSLEHRRCLSDTYLTPTWSTDTNRKDCEEPHVDFAEPCEETEKSTPYTNEEGENEDEDFPFLKFGAPQEHPVPSVRLGGTD